MIDPGMQVGEFCAARREMEEWWRLLRALRGGTLAMRREGTAYNPMDWRERKDPKAYEERLSRSFLFNAYDDAVRKIAARPFQKPVAIGQGIDPRIERIETDADRQGTSLTVFAGKLFEDVADRGMALFLVDHVPAIVRADDGTERAMSLGEEDAAGVRPYFCRIAPDNLIGWKSELVGGVDTITELRVREWAYEETGGFGQVLKERIRVWGPETWELWERDASGLQVADPTARYSMQGQSSAGGFVRVIDPTPHRFPGKRIPLVVIYAEKLDTLYAKPPMLNLAWLNVQHWQSSSQQSNILHYARAPILTGRGLDQDMVDNGVKLGAGATLLSRSEAAEWGYVEVAGTSIQAGERDLAAIEMRMQAIGMAPLLVSKGPDTATGEAIDEVRSTAEAQKWAEALEWGLYRGFELAAQWQMQALPEGWSVTVFRDFGLVHGRAADITLLQGDARENRITTETYLREAQRRGLYGDDMVPDEEVASVQESSAPMPPMPVPPDAQDQPQDGAEPMDPAQDPGEDAADAEDPESAAPPVPARAGRR